MTLVRLPPLLERKLLGNRATYRQQSHRIRQVAGLGNDDQAVQITVDAACINSGGQPPQAENNKSFSAAGTFPVQNGKAEFTLTVTATFQTNCSPPMTVEFSSLGVTDVIHGLARSFPGPS